jgi:hypothetical protein
MLVGKHQKSLEHGISISAGDFSNNFWPIPARKHKELAETYREKSGQFPMFSCRIRLPESSIWVRIPNK